MGTCGCCTVLIDGKPRLSCMTLALEAKGRQVTTVEGLSDGHHLHPIQEMFAECGGSQCGFCTPGFLVTSAALLETNPTPTRQEAMDAIEGNLCRCTGYQQIVDSIMSASKILSEGFKISPLLSQRVIQIRALEAELMPEDKKEIVGYRQQPGKLDFTGQDQAAHPPIRKKEIPV